MYEGTNSERNAISNIERRTSNVEVPRLNAEGGMNIKNKGVRTYEGTRVRSKYGVRNEE